MILKFKNLRHYTSILKKSLIFFLKVKYNLRSKTNKHHPTLYDKRNSRTTTRYTKFTNHYSTHEIHKPLTTNCSSHTKHETPPH